MRLCHLNVFLLCLSLSGALTSGQSFQDQEEGMEQRLLTSIRQLTFAGRRSGEGYFSRDGSKLIFQSERNPANPFFQIYLLHLETGNLQRLSTGKGKTTCAWMHPSGKKALFASTHEDPEAERKQKEEMEQRDSGKKRRYSWDFDEHFDLYEVQLDTHKLNRLTASPGYDAEASWSPDGRLVVFSSNRHAYTDGLSPREKAISNHDQSYSVDIYLMNSDGSNVRRLTHTAGYDGGPFFSPDGEKICWRRFSEDGATAEVYTMNIDGTEQKQITKMGAMSWAPFYHPSETYLIFSTNLHGFSNFELYLVDIAGEKKPVRVTYTEGFDGLPAFLPSGELLAWTSNRSPSGQSQIFFAEWNHQAARRFLGFSPLPQTRPEIRTEDLHSHVTFLASEEMEGRMTGSRGAKRASQYAASILEALGLEPAGDEGTYFGEFEFTAGVSLGSDNQLVLRQEGSPIVKNWRLDEDWRPLAFSKTGRFAPAPLSFAGYGIVAPLEGSYDEYDSYVHLDVTDQWVLVFRYLPEDISPERRQNLARYSSIRYKAMLARERGARGILVVSGPNSKVKSQLLDLAFDASLGTTGIGALSISDKLAESLLEPAGKSLSNLQDQLDSGKSVMGFMIPKLTLESAIDVKQERRKGRNVLARLPAPENFSRAPALVVGAHLDHLGRGMASTSRARSGEKHAIHYGADDNASGVGGVLEMAEYFAGQKKAGALPMKRDLLFALWSGEELGLLGSSDFTRRDHATSGNGSEGEKDFAAYLNMDMIGRLRERLILQGVGSSSFWPREIERGNTAVGLPIVTRSESYLPTDATSFYLQKIPVLSAFTGAHADYHTPRDTADKLNYQGIRRITQLMTRIARSLVTNTEVPDYQETTKPTGSMGRTRLRAYLGTIPDYSQTHGNGVKLAGVAGGGPADKAGIRAGDVIIRVAGKTVENIYDYTYAIDALKIAEPVEIVVLRGEKRLTLDIVPESRD